MSEIRKISNQEVKFEQLNRQAVSFTKRRWRDTQETISQIEGAMSHFGKSINPATIQTMMTLIGDKSLQFEFVQSKQNPERVPHLLYFDENTKQLHAGGGWLKHHTLGITEIKPNRSHEEYKYWLLTPFVSGRLDEADKKYYLYARVSQSQEVGSFLLSENAIELEQEAGYYHLLVGTLNTEFEGDRGFALLYGFTEILPGQMKIDKISSGNGRQYIEFLDDRININANVTFTDGSPAIDQLKTAVSPDLLSLENRLKQYTDTIKIGGRNLALKSNQFNTGNHANGITPSITSEGYLQVITSAGNENWHTNWDINRRNLNDFFNENDDFIVIFWTKRLSGTGKPIIYLNDVMGYVGLQGDIDNQTFKPIYHIGKWKKSHFAPHLGWEQTQGIFQISHWAIFKGNKLEDWKPAPEDAISSIEQAKDHLQRYADAQKELAKTLAIAHADNQISQAEQRQIDNATQKLQEAKAFAQQKVNELQIGGVNLLRETKEFVIKNQANHMMSPWAGSGEIVSERFNGNAVRKINSDWLGFRADISNIIDKPVIISFWAKTNAAGKFECFALRNDPATSHLHQYMQLSNNGNLIPDGQWHRYTMLSPKGMNFGKNSPNGFVEFYQITGDIFVSSLQIEIGNKPTYYSPSPQDIESEVQTAKAWADMFNDAEKQNIKQISEMFQKQNDFVGGTQVVKNTITTGALMVGNVLGGNAGINGSGLDTTDVRFWAGTSFENRANAPFRVLDNGELHASKTRVSGHIEATSGRIGGFEINNNFLGKKQSTSFNNDRETGVYISSHEGLVVWAKEFSDKYFRYIIKEVVITPISLIFRERDIGNPYFLRKRVLHITGEYN